MSGDGADVWTWQCDECGAQFGALPEACPACGHDRFRKFRRY